MQYTTRRGDDPAEAHVNYECPCGCTAGVIFRQDGGTEALGQCCCGRLLWLGEGAEGRVRGGFEPGVEYSIDETTVTLPWGQAVQAVLAVPQDAAHGRVAVVAGTVHDPVCHMDIAPQSAAGTSQYRGTTYYFCARGCKLDFDADPEAVLQAESAYDHAAGGSHTMSGAGAPAAERKPWWQFWR